MKAITDGSAVFTVRDKRMQSMIDFFYPVGSVYVSADKSKTKADFPFMSCGTWEEVPANLVLQTGAASEAGSQKEAGLPNIIGKLATDPDMANMQLISDQLVEVSGAFSMEGEGTKMGTGTSGQKMGVRRIKL